MISNDPVTDSTHRPDLVDPGTPVDNTDNSWWSVDLVLAIHNASSEFPLLRPRMKEIESRNVEHRANAYDAIIRYAINQADEAVPRTMLFAVISQAYVDEPDEASARRPLDVTSISAHTVDRWSVPLSLANLHLDWLVGAVCDHQLATVHFHLFTPLCRLTMPARSPNDIAQRAPSQSAVQ